jgi:hypothetical protein
MLYLDYCVVKRVFLTQFKKMESFMCQTPYVVVKNYMELLAFDDVGVAAVNSVIEVEPSGDNEPWLLIALLSLSTMQQVNETIEWLKLIHQRAKLAEKPMLLAIHLSPLMLTHPQERVEFLRTLNYLADSVILISPLEDGMPAQALARLPQFLVDTVFRPGMINLDCLDLSNRMQLGIAFFAYGLQRHSDDSDVEEMSTPMAEIRQQWRDSYLPSAHVKAMLACIEGNEDVSLEAYFALKEQLQQSHDVFKPVENVSLSLGMSVKADTESEETHIGVLFFGLDFYESAISSINQ